MKNYDNPDEGPVNFLAYTSISYLFPLDEYLFVIMIIGCIHQRTQKAKTFPFSIETQGELSRQGNSVFRLQLVTGKQKKSGGRSPNS